VCNAVEDLAPSQSFTGTGSVLFLPESSLAPTVIGVLALLLPLRPFMAI